MGGGEGQSCHLVIVVRPSLDVGGRIENGGQLPLVLAGPSTNVRGDVTHIVSGKTTNVACTIENSLAHALASHRANEQRRVRALASHVERIAN